VVLLRAELCQLSFRKLNCELDESAIQKERRIGVKRLSQRLTSLIILIFLTFSVDRGYSMSDNGEASSENELLEHPHLESLSIDSHNAWSQSEITTEVSAVCIILVL